MPRKLSNPFASPSSTNTTSTISTSTSNSTSTSISSMPSSTSAERAPAQRRHSQSKGNRIAQFFSPSSKTREPPTAQRSLLAMQQAATATATGTLQISAATLPLPTISLSTATAGEANCAEPPSTLFQPSPSAAEATRQARIDAQFGPLLSPRHRYVSKHKGGSLPKPIAEEPPYYFVLTTYVSYLLLIFFGHTRDFLNKYVYSSASQSLRAPKGYAPLNDDFEAFYTRRLKQRIDDCFARPTTGVPGRYITLMDRTSSNFNLSYEYTGTHTQTLNVSSYNYLGFAQSEGPCADAAEECLRKYGLSVCSPRADAGTLDLALEVERGIARFVGKPAAMVFSMGFVTNASSFPALVSKGCLILSDELNPASIRVGARISGAVIRAFKHNDVQHLEKMLREAISQGQPRTHRPWRKILVAVEGLYSMEGTLVDLPGVVALKNKYKFFLYVDEAHSIGAIGPRGRGVCDFFGVDPSQIDLLMGTLTKSFGANGGYVAADKPIIDKLKASNAATLLGESPAPAVLMQILVSLQMISGDIFLGQGLERLQRIAFNSRYLRLGLKRLGFIVYGHDDSPIIPVPVFNPGKLSAFSHEMLKRKISVVMVGYPGCPLQSGRVRFCISAAHNKDDLDRILTACDEIGDIMQLKFSTGMAGGLDPLPAGITPDMEAEWRKANGLEGVYKPPRWKLADVIARSADDVQERLR